MKRQKKQKQMHNQPVAFNLADPDQKKMFEHAMNRPNFSGYVKRLIQRDMEGGNKTKVDDREIVDTSTNEFDPNGFI